MPTNGTGLIPSANLQYITGGNFPDAATAPPYAAPDTLTVLSSSPVSLDVSANDFDAVPASLIISAFTQPAHGSITWSGRTVTYTPMPNYSGTDSLTYTIQNGTGQTATATATVSIIVLQHFTAYNDSSGTGSPAGATSINFNATAVPLKNFSSDTTLPVTITTTGSNVTAQSGAACAAGTDAFLTFDGKINPSGTIGYGGTPWWYQIQFNNLDPVQEYEFACFVNRAGGYTNRFATYTITSADSSTQSSTTGVTVNSPTSVTQNTGENTANGYVVRWTKIRPGSDGSFTIKSESTGAAYAMNGFMLRSSVPVANNYATWRGQQFTPANAASETISGPTADTEKDGIQNLMEYALGLNPNASDKLTTKITNDLETISTNRYLRLTITKNPNATDVTYSVEVSSDLISWNTAETVIETNTTSSLIVRDNVPITPGNRRFIRLRVTSP